MTAQPASLAENVPLQLPALAVCSGSMQADAKLVSRLLDAAPAGPDRAFAAMDIASLGTADGDLWQRDNMLIGCTGDPYWHDAECQVEAENAGIASSIALAYRKYGDGFLDRLCGEFSLTLWDGEARRLICAVDRFSRHPLYWHGDHQGLALGSTADALLAHPAVGRRLSNQGLYHYLFFHMIPAQDCIYEDMQKLPAAHCLHWREGQGVSIHCYWQPAFSEQSPEPDALASGVLDTLRQSVRRYDRGNGTGSFLSGGLDSSTVTGLLAEQRPGADSFSIGFDATGYDEIEYARIANRHFGSKGHEYYVRPEDVLDALPQVAAAYDEPFGNSSALPAFFCARLAKADGMTRLLAGDGGDELYAGNERYAKQGVFEIYQSLPASVQTLLRGGTALIPAGMPVLGKAKSYVSQAKVPLPTRLQSYNFIYRLGLESVLEPEFIEAIDAELPDRRDREIYHRLENASTLNRMLYLDWQHTLADNDLRKVGRMCALAGIDVRYPMLDEAVVEHSTRIPSRLKLPAGRLRDFYKQAVQDFLPPQIINKSKQGFGLPFGVWLAEHRQLHELATDNLSRLKRRHIVRADFIERILHLHQAHHAAYYGEFIWVLVMLELWLSSRGFEP